jgi:general secretion pathway protein A
VETHLLLDPSFSNPRELLTAVAQSFGLPDAGAAKSEWQIKEGIKNHLFQRGVDEKKTVVLILDEGQKLPEFCLELLREFLNYETNECKLLQIVIFAQNEFRQILESHANFADRVNQYYFLGPLNFRETRTMIRFRLEQAGREEGSPFLFTLPGMWAIYRATGGYPRKIVTLCHQIMLSLIIQNRVKAGWWLVRSTTGRAMPEMIRKERWAAARVFLVLLLAAAGLALFVTGGPDLRKVSFPWKPAAERAAAPEIAAAPVKPEAAAMAPASEKAGAGTKPAAVPAGKPEAAPISPAVTPAPMEKAGAAPKAGAPVQEKQQAVPVRVASPAPAQPKAEEIAAAAAAGKAGAGTKPATIPAGRPEAARAAASAPAPKTAETAGREAASPAGGKAEIARVATVSPTPEKTAPGQAPPEQLGRLHIRRGGTVFRLLLEIYGSTETERFRAVTRANPHIEDMNWVLAGETIHFPALRGRGNPLDPGKTWVQIARKGSLDDAYNFFKDYPADQPGIRLIPMWNPREGLAFSMVLKRGFDSPAAAGEAMRSLPRSFASKAEILKNQESDTVYFVK